MIEGNTVAEALEVLAERVARLSVKRGDPHKFFEERSEIAHDMRGVADWSRSGRKPITAAAEHPAWRDRSGK